MNGYRTIADLQERLANAKRRTLFWSGNPSFRDGARAKATSSGKMSERYELAMCDQKSLVQLIEQLGGKADIRDYREEFINRYHAAISKTATA
jgi:hypothetical protein